MNSKAYIVFPFILLTFNLSVVAKDLNPDSLIQKLEFSEDNISKCDALNNIASVYLLTNPSEAILYAEKAFHLSFQLDYEKGLATAYLIKGEANEELLNYDAALNNYFSSLIIQKHLGKEEEVAKINYRLGRICKTTGNYEKALEYCLNALRIREQQDDQLSISEIYLTMGSIFKYIGDYDKSLEYYFKSMDLEKKYREGGVHDITYNNIGIVYSLLDRWKEAIKYYSKSLEMRRNKQDSVEMAIIYNNIAVVLLNQNKPDSAFVYLEKGQAIDEKYGDRKNIIYIYHNIARYFHMRNDYKQALLYINKSLVAAHQLKVSQPKVIGYKLLTDIYQSSGEFEKALESQMKYTQAKDSIFNMEKSMRIAQLEMIYDSEIKEIERNLKDQRKLFVNIAVVSTLFFLLVILFFIYKNLKAKFNQNKLRRINLEMEKEKLTIELETKNREITRNIIHLTEKNELLHDLKNTLQKLKANMKEENKPLIQSVINDMKASNNNQIWQEFEVRFINTHKNFYNNLVKDHPDLTQNEKRLAAFLKLNMVTKEISMITKQSTHSITVARTRLRKKLNLSHTDTSLVSYLAKY